MAGSLGLAWRSCRSWQEEVNASQEFGRRSLQLYVSLSTVKAARVSATGKLPPEAAIITAHRLLSTWLTGQHGIY